MNSRKDAHWVLGLTNERIYNEKAIGFDLDLTHRGLMCDLPIINANVIISIRKANGLSKIV